MTRRSFQQMGSFVGTAVLELENENTVAVNQKMLSVDDSPRISSFYTRLDDLSYKYVLNGVVSSIKLVFLSKKLNLLVPCGPLAVIVDLFTNHHVSCGFLYSPTIHAYFYFNFVCFVIYISIFFSGMDLLSKLIRHHTSGRAFRLGHRVIHHTYCLLYF